MTGAPRAEQLDIPPEYGSPSAVLSWPPVQARLEQALHYWLSTVRPDGRPHAVPLDGLWLDDAWYFGGVATTVKHRNLLSNPHVVLHLEDATSAVIVEGSCEIIQADEELAAQLADASAAKYGYGPPPATYRQGVWRLAPTRVMAWTDLTRDPTRFTFPPREPAAAL